MSGDTAAGTTRGSWFEVDRQPVPGATPKQALRRFVGNAYVVHARAGRAEFWWIWLFQTALGLAWNLGVGSLVRGAGEVSWSVGAYGSSLFAYWQVVTSGGTVGGAPGGTTWVGIVWGLWCLMTFVPMATLTIRRLHAAGAWGWGWFWLGVLLPFLQIVVVLMLARETRPPSARFRDRELDLAAPQATDPPLARPGDSG